MPFTDIAKAFVRKELPESKVELKGDIPYEALLPYRSEALKNIAKAIEMPGFRKGHVPPDMALKQAGERIVLEEALELFMADFYGALVDTHTVDAIGRPDIGVTKLTPGEPVGVVVVTAIYPKVTIAKDWKTLGQNIPLEIPEATEGETEEDKAKKESAAKDKRRGKIIEALLEKTTVDVPQIFIDSELEKIMRQMQEDVERMGLQFEKYLEMITKTEEQLRDEFKTQARQRAMLQLALNECAEEEKVEIGKEILDAEVAHALEQFPKAKPDLVRVYLETVLRNQKIFELLESEGAK